MIEILLLIVALVWLGGTLTRIYKQARFYQIEEYKSNRYLRWLFKARERWLPNRALVAWLIACAFSVILSEGGLLVPAVVGVIAAIIAGIPPAEGEIKKRFNRTPRATRLLGGAFLLAAAVSVVGWLVLIGRDLSGLRGFSLVISHTLGAVVFLLAPLWLAGGNLLMYPVEAVLRQRFIANARRVLAEVQPTVVGITGSYGKTTTKNFITEILNGRYRAHATPKSFNTMMGVCIAINRDLADNYAVEYFVVEMGAYIQGEIRRICDLTPPRISVVVEVGPQHLERFGSLENIAIAKYEIIKALPPDGVGVFNWDNPYVRQMYERGYPATRLAVSKSIAPDAVPAGGPRFIASAIEATLNGLQFTVTDVETGASERFATAVLGEHNVTNILLAAAVSVHEGMSLRDVARQVHNLKPAESRLVTQHTTEGITIINDAYSANPAGVVSALKVLGMHQGGKRLLITPGMVELGDLHAVENEKLGMLATQYATEIILIGEQQTAPIRQGILKTDFPQEHLHTMATLSEAVQWYQANLQSGDTVLFLNDLPDTY